MTSKEGVRTGTGFTSSFIKYMSYTDGRDKVNRTVQYGARFILWYFDRYGGVLSTIQKVQNLESALTNSRKLFRMARTLDFIQKALDALGKKDETEKALEVLGYLFKAIWLFSDHLIWFGKIKLIQIMGELPNHHMFLKCSIRDLISEICQTSYADHHGTQKEKLIQSVFQARQVQLTSLQLANKHQYANYCTRSLLAVPVCA
ncbi:putative peroxisomal membrane protein 11A [Apostichopus japonicus]|uniref:Putative peroxisomal membrane protein 11A n=1 Tax=Stichopus japonicus TaxID=307972 RepID=A0A2G8L537_STIJA|nr:putative peroxisomal membrane protein 11A [Apostichopus japonicus]